MLGYIDITGVFNMGIRSLFADEATAASYAVLKTENK